MTRRHRGGAGGLLIVVLASLGACSGDDGGGTDGNGAASSTSAPSEERTTSSTTPGASTSSTAAAGRVITVVVSGGKVEGGFRREKLKLGEPIVLRVMSDTADEVHVHGYDKKVDVAAGGTAELSFIPDIPGVFEVELEERKLTLLELEVQ